MGKGETIMFSRGSIQFFINGPPPVAKSAGPPFLADSTNRPNLQISKIADLQNEAEEKIQNLNSLVNKTHNTLLTIRSMRIFDLFPDILIVDENKISFIYRDAFGVKSIHSVLIENITYVEAHTSLFTGCLVVMDSSNYRHPIELKIENVRKHAAVRARKLIQGLVHAKTLKLDLNQLSPFELEKKLEELGMVNGED